MWLCLTFIFSRLYYPFVAKLWCYPARANAVRDYGCCWKLCHACASPYSAPACARCIYFATLLDVELSLYMHTCLYCVVALTSPRLVDSSTQTEPPPVTALTGKNDITCATASLLLWPLFYSSLAIFSRYDDGPMNDQGVQEEGLLSPVLVGDAGQASKTCEVCSREQRGACLGWWWQLRGCRWWCCRSWLAAGGWSFSWARQQCGDQYRCNVRLTDMWLYFITFSCFP